MAKLVMLVEDERHISQVVERRLVAEGLEVAIARDGLQALEMAADRTPDAIVTDLEMPRMNGLELIAKLEQDSVLAQIPTMMLTARGYLAGKDGVPERIRVFAKPFSARKLVEAITEMLDAGTGGTDNAPGIIAA